MQPYNNTLVELHVPDFQQVKDYYIPLGFEIVWERPPEGFKGYLVMKMENNILPHQWLFVEMYYQAQLSQSQIVFEVPDLTFDSR
jgi:hypothetical protein